MKHPKYNEILNCLDIRWYDYINSLNFIPVPLPNVKSEYIAKQVDSIALDGLILSGGNNLSEVSQEKSEQADINKLRDAYELSLISQCLKENIPILGVCRGLQVLNHFYGGSLTRIKGHAGKGRHSIFMASSNKFLCCPDNVNSFHNYGINDNQLGNGLSPLAYDKDGHVEAFCHTSDPVLAIMWHPERERIFVEEDIELFKRFFEK